MVIHREEIITPLLKDEDLLWRSYLIFLWLLVQDWPDFCQVFIDLSSLHSVSDLGSLLFHQLSFLRLLNVFTPMGNWLYLSCLWTYRAVLVVGNRVNESTKKSNDISIWYSSGGAHWKSVFVSWKFDISQSVEDLCSQFWRQWQL